MITTYAYNHERYRPQLEAFLKGIGAKIQKGELDFGPPTTANTGFYKAPEWLPVPLAAVKLTKKGVEPMHIIVCETKRTLTYHKWEKQCEEVGNMSFWAWLTGKQKKARESLGKPPQCHGYVIVITGDKGELLFILHPEEFPEINPICRVAYEQQIKRVDEALTNLLKDAETAQNVA